MRHKHAEFFIAIANGELVDSWETRHLGTKKWSNLYANLHLIATFPEDWEVRRKQPTRVVNGFTVPEPLRVAPVDEVSYFVSSSAAELFYSRSCWVNDALDKRWLERGLIHLTEDAAIANAKAMCGIDPGGKNE